MILGVFRTKQEDTKKSTQNTIKILTIKCLYHVLSCKDLNIFVVLK